LATATIFTSGSAFKNDNKKAFNPFSTGLRNCPGRNLACHEMRFILTKLVWWFYFELAEGNGKGESWLDQRVLLFLGEKRLLAVWVSEIVRTTCSEYISSHMPGPFGLVFGVFWFTETGYANSKSTITPVLGDV
jgi:hypothetical protein